MFARRLPAVICVVVCVLLIFSGINAAPVNTNSEGTEIINIKPTMNLADNNPAMSQDAVAGNAVAIPEPATLTLLALGSLMMFKRKRDTN